MNTLVSVIVPVYNVAPYIERCARSLMEQTLDELEYIFVDDASQDESMEILERVIAEYPRRKERVRTIRNEKNQGLAATRFVGMEHARGTYIYHCDSDDRLERNALELMLSKALSTNADIVMCEAVKEKAHNSTPYVIPYDEETWENGLLALNFSEVHVAIWNKLVRKELYDRHEIRFFPGINMGEDAALTVRLRYYSRKTVVVHKKLYHYNRMNAASMCAAPDASAIAQQIALAKQIEAFFTALGAQKEFRHVINYYKFMSKQMILRQQRDYKKWYHLFRECRQSIPRFRSLTIVGRIKWLMAAYMYYPMLLFFGTPKTLCASRKNCQRI